MALREGCEHQMAIGKIRQVGRAQLMMVSPDPENRGAMVMDGYE